MTVKYGEFKFPSEFGFHGSAGKGRVHVGAHTRKMHRAKGGKGHATKAGQHEGHKGPHGPHHHSHVGKAHHGHTGPHGHHHLSPVHKAKGGHIKGKKGYEDDEEGVRSPPSNRDPFDKSEHEYSDDQRTPGGHFAKGGPAKAMVKKAIHMHDEQGHGKARTNLSKLNRGGQMPPMIEGDSSPNPMVTRKPPMKKAK